MHRTWKTVLMAALVALALFGIHGPARAQEAHSQARPTRIPTKPTPKSRTPTPRASG